MRLLFAPMLLLITTALHAQGTDVQRFGDWIHYQVPAEGSEPAIDVVETAQDVRGVSMIYSCTRHIDSAEESLLLLNPGFADFEAGERFEALFTFGEEQRRGYADAELQADPRHGTLDVVAGREHVLQQMQRYNAFIITQAGEAITAIAIPTAGFADALEAARQRCGISS